MLTFLADTASKHLQKRRKKSSNICWDEKCAVVDRVASMGHAHDQGGREASRTSDPVVEEEKEE